jgi:hypothetical protein
VSDKKGENEMEIKLKERLLRRIRTPQMTRNSGKPYRKITGMTSGNIAGDLAESIAYEQSRPYLTQIAEIELKRAQALAEAHRTPVH